MEGKLVASTVTRLAEKDSIPQDAVRHIQRSLRGFEEIIDGLGFCLSEESDLLSQWRGYAGDATGVAIGFSTEYLNSLSMASKSHDTPGFTLEKVEYESSSHEALVKPTYNNIKQLIENGALDRPTGLINNIGKTDQEIKKNVTDIAEARSKLSREFLSLFPLLFCLKSYAFREEREYRLLSYLVTEGEDTCSYRVVGNRIVPYRKVELAELEPSPIVEVILGPKHGTPPKIVENFLKVNRYGPVKVKRSEASYR